MKAKIHFIFFCIGIVFVTKLGVKKMQTIGIGTLIKPGYLKNGKTPFKIEIITKRFNKNHHSFASFFS